MAGPTTDTAIAGLGMTELGKVYGRSPRRLAADAVRAAAADAGLASGRPRRAAREQRHVRLPGHRAGPRRSACATCGCSPSMNSFGATAVAMVSYASAAMLRAAPRRRSRACSPTRRCEPEQSAGSAYHRDAEEWHGLGGLRAALGFRSVNAYYALAARRHMERYGTTSEQLGAIAVATRQWARRQPARPDAGADLAARPPGAPAGSSSRCTCSTAASSPTAASR